MMIYLPKLYTAGKAYYVYFIDGDGILLAYNIEFPANGVFTAHNQKWQEFYYPIKLKSYLKCRHIATETK